MPPESSKPPKSQYWWHAVSKPLPSSRINSLVAIIALGLGVYYYYGQYVISLKSWEVGVWKDCHDRLVGHFFWFQVVQRLSRPQDIANTSICLRYENVSYTTITSREIGPVTGGQPAGDPTIIRQIKSSF